MRTDGLHPRRGNDALPWDAGAKVGLFEATECPSGTGRLSLSLIHLKLPSADSHHSAVVVNADHPDWQQLSTVFPSLLPLGTILAGAASGSNQVRIFCTQSMSSSIPRDGALPPKYIISKVVFIVRMADYERGNLGSDSCQWLVMGPLLILAYLGRKKRTL